MISQGLILALFLGVICLFSLLTEYRNKVLFQKETQSVGTVEFIVNENSRRNLGECTDSVWCNVPMPQKSLFRFREPPTDPIRWKEAQYLASTGSPVLLQKIIKYFPNYFNFLDGDTLFRTYHLPVDYFLDDNHGFEVLNTKYVEPVEPPKKNAFGEAYVQYNWVRKGPNTKVLPEYYDISDLARAPVIHFGYFAFERLPPSPSLHFQGPLRGEAIIDRRKIIDLWKLGKRKINRPWIGLHSANENWGLLSTYFPNRTTNWGRCCEQTSDQVIYEILNDKNTLLFLVNQHHNVTHPKLLTLPRGLPIHGDHSRRIIWDKMRQLASYPSKKQLMFTASSNWGYRPKILECLAKKFDPSEAQFNLHVDKNLQGRLTPFDYYDKLGWSMFSIALPGLGYDTFRLWESMTIGTIPILERGVGFDKSLWRLPALLVDDFDNVTPQLLRMAYVEALYRVHEFEFERLTQSFWWNFIMNVSVSMNSQSIHEKFPLEAEDPNFARPFVRFDCFKTNSCGKGTKKIPDSFC